MNDSVYKYNNDKNNEITNNNESQNTDTQQFWLNDPSILFQTDYITDFYPKPEYSFTHKLNIITRIIVILTIVGFVITKSMNILISSAISIFIIVVLYQSKMKEKTKQDKIKNIKESFTTNPQYYETFKSDFTTPQKKNPVMNVLLTEIDDNPNRKPAAPSFNPKVEEEINENAKKNLDPRLFQDLGDNFNFDNSMRSFYTTPNTQIPNDQKAFAEFCYGTMPSCKEGNPFQCEKKNYRYINM